MPVYIRKFWISKHNQQAEEERLKLEGKKEGGVPINGEAINVYAKQEQAKAKAK